MTMDSRDKLGVFAMTDNYEKKAPVPVSWITNG